MLVFFLLAGDLCGSVETPSVENLVSWLLEHPHVPEDDSDSESYSYDVHSNSDSMSEEFAELDSFEVNFKTFLLISFCKGKFNILSRKIGTDDGWQYCYLE